jgi:hypothetical protein
MKKITIPIARCTPLLIVMFSLRMRDNNICLGVVKVSQLGVVAENNVEELRHPVVLFPVLGLSIQSLGTGKCRFGSSEPD